jgi:hypothetical protein
MLVKDLSYHVKVATEEQSKGSQQIIEVVENVNRRANEISDVINIQRSKMEKIMQAT